MDFMSIKDLETLDLEHSDNFGIVLCGGGAAGRFQAGVLLALAQRRILEKAKVLIGTSVGGLNAALFAMFGSAGDPSIVDDNGVPVPPLYKEAYDVWNNITKNSDIYNGDINSIVGKIGAGLGFVFGADSILDPQPLYNRLDSIFGELTMGEVSDLFGTELILSSQDLNENSEEFYCSFIESTKSMKVKTALKATAGIPGIFKSVPFQSEGDTVEHWHVDGGTGANNPFLAIEKYNEAFPDAKLNKILIIYCYPDIHTVDTKVYRCFRDVLLRVVGAMLNTQEQMTETTVKLVVSESNINVMALWPKNMTCDALDFTKVSLLDDGYKYGMDAVGYDYRTKKEMSISEFLASKR
jgi:predicted acylesterase/phospholipase RssA